MLARVTLFDSGEVLGSGRIRLSSLTPDAFGAMTGWLSAAVAPEWSIEDLRTAANAYDCVLVGDPAGAPIGLAVVIPNEHEPGAATVPFLSIDPERRFRGLGGEAGLALERTLRRKLGVEKVYAPLHESRGLAVYFWLRLGFRPLSSASSPGPLLGLTEKSNPGIWMLRDQP